MRATRSWELTGWAQAAQARRKRASRERFIMLLRDAITHWRYGDGFRVENAGAHPAGVGEFARRGRDDDFISGVVERPFYDRAALRIDQGEVFENGVDVALFGLADGESVGAEMDGRALSAETPGEKG